MKRSVKTNREGGFTLVEIAIVVLISSIILTMLAQGYKIYVRDKQRQETLDHIEVITSALREYVGEYGRYPCPADPTLPSNDQDYGTEQFLAAGAPGGDPLLDTCDATNLIVVDGNRDTDGDTVVDKVAIGAVPFATIIDDDPDNDPLTPPIQVDVPLRGKDALDGWKNKITYAVSERLTDRDSYRNNAGVIDVRDEINQSVVPTVILRDAAGNPVLDGSGNPALVGTAQAVLVSHGENGRWAYTAEGAHQFCGGITLPPLPDGTFPPASSLSELSNCADVPDSTFLSGLRNLTAAQYNDDITQFIIIQDSRLWGQNNDTAFNTNPGLVGFGVDPDKQLDVNGALVGDELVAPQLCGNGSIINGPTPADCMDVKVFAGDRVDCSTLAGAPSGAAVIGIFNNFNVSGAGANDTKISDLCATPPVTPPVAGLTCLTDGTEYLRDLLGSGQIRCCRFDNPASCRLVPP
jgi:type II secretory pathway pseudopilin PulG